MRLHLSRGCCDIRASRRSPVASLVPPATAATASCVTSWGSLPRADPDPRLGDGTVSDVRSGRHECFDRIVIDVAGVPASQVGYAVAYVDTVARPGSGSAVPLDGGARLRVRVTVPAYDVEGRATYDPVNRDRVVDLSGYSTVRQVALAGSFEGETTFGVGVRSRLPYRVQLLDGPGTGSRVVLDVAHRW